MIIFDLHCASGHVFEAWFGSSRDYDDQQQRGLIACPVCLDTQITKAVMAPHVAPKGNQRSVAKADHDRSAPVAEGAAPVASLSADDAARLKQMLATIAAAQRNMLRHSHWVGDRFAEEARAVHYGEKPADSGAMHGEVTPQQAEALIEEGIPVAPLLFPVVPPESAH